MSLTSTSATLLQPALPAAAYRDPEQFRRERDAIFWREWFCVGRAEQIAQPGDYCEVSIVGERLLLIRGRDEQIRAFYNVCRHRGSRLCGSPLIHEPAADPLERLGRFRGAIVCPYHAWSYHLDGTFRSAPFLGIDPERARTELSLIEVALATWGGFLFVNLSFPPSDAPTHTKALLAQIGRVAEQVVRYPLVDLRRGKRRTYEVKANWKVLAENYNECYHCGPLHPELIALMPAFKAQGGLNLDWDHGIPHRAGAWTFSSTGTASRPPFPGLSEVERTHHKSGIVYPNLWLSLAAEHVAAFTLWPLTATRTLVACDFLFHSDEIMRPEFDPADVVEFWELVNRQDWTICESVQDGMNSRGFRVGLMAPMEDASMDIRRYVEERLSAMIAQSAGSQAPHPGSPET